MCRPAQRLTPFLITRQHRRFAEFADAVRRYRYIGACYGAPGIGKTLSARTYAAADDCDQWFKHDQLHGERLPPTVFTSRAIMWTPYMTTTPRELEQEVGFLAGQVDGSVRVSVEKFCRAGGVAWTVVSGGWELVVPRVGDLVEQRCRPADAGS